jgi:hypothetical protein
MDIFIATNKSANITSCCTGRFGLVTVFEKGAQKQRQSQAPVNRALGEHRFIYIKLKVSREFMIRIFVLIFSCMLLLMSNTSYAGSSEIATAYENHKSDIQVTGVGEVIRTLADDLDGSRHQKFILKLDSNQTILISHNIDLSRKIKSLKKGDIIEFYGEYEWNHKGGVVHWTHLDPNGKHLGGWLKHKGTKYQ